MGNCCCCIPSEQEITVDKQNEDMNNNETVDIVDNVKDENVESNDENGELDNAENERLIEEENDNGECENACITENNENVSEKLDDKSVDKDSLESDKEDDTHFYGSGRIYDNEEKISERDSSLRRGLTDSTYACQWEIAAQQNPKIPDTAFFGQVTVDGEVLEVAGVKEKLGAAHGVGITNIILPECMKNEIEGLTQETLKTFKFIYISDFFDSLKYLFP
uniref:Lon proteolytic domain-containing protein n=1 Tax=Meloidogyne javanica TaxID=6303 RepID=A0A915M3V7_MELJA